MVTNMISILKNSVNTVQSNFKKTVRPSLGEGDGTPLQYSCLKNPINGEAWWAAVHGVAKSRTWLCGFTFTFNFHALEKEMATHSSVLAWRIPGTGEPDRLPSVGSHRLGHDWRDLAAAAAAAAAAATARPSLAYIIGFLPFVLTVLSRTLPGLCHSNMLTRSCLPLVAHTSFWIISCFFPTLLSFPLWHSPYFLAWFCPRRYNSSLHVDLVNLSTDARLSELCL